MVRRFISLQNVWLFVGFVGGLDFRPVNDFVLRTFRWRVDFLRQYNSHGTNTIKGRVVIDWLSGKKNKSLLNFHRRSAIQCRN